MNELKQKEGLICSDAFMQKKYINVSVAFLFCYQKLKPEVELQLMLTSGDRSLTDLACSKRSPLLLPRFYFFALLFTSHHSPLSKRLEQAITDVEFLSN